MIVNLILSKRQYYREQKEPEAENSTSKGGEEVHEITRVFLSDLVLLLNHSKDNRRSVRFLIRVLLLTGQL